MDVFGLLVFMKVLKIFKESSVCFRAFDRYESFKDFWRVE